MVDRLLATCVTVGIQAILAMSVNMISGYARRLTLGQAAFAALGAYASALLSLRLGLSFWWACPLSFSMTGGLGMLLGLPILRLPGPYLLVMTLGMHAIIQQLLRSGRFAGGYFGLGQIAVPRFFGLPLEGSAYLPLVLLALFGCIGLDRWFWHSRYGRRLRQRSTETTSAATSPTVDQAVWVAFVMSTVMASLAGSLFAHFEAFISPFDFNLETSLFVLALAAGGGLGSFWGPIVGAVVLGGAFELIRPLAVYRLLLSGLVFLLVGLWCPHGLVAFWRPDVAESRGAVPVRPSRRSFSAD